MCVMRLYQGSGPGLTCRLTATVVRPGRSGTGHKAQGWSPFISQINILTLVYSTSRTTLNLKINLHIPKINLKLIFTYKTQHLTNACMSEYYYVYYLKFSDKLSQVNINMRNIHKLTSQNIH